MKIIKYIRQYSYICVIVFFLLIIQTALMLASPYITSNIINIGLQQKGIQYCHSPIYTAKTFEKLITTEPNLKEIFLKAYDYDNSTNCYYVKDEYRNNTDIDEALKFPTAYLYHEQNQTYNEYKNATEEGIAAQSAKLFVENELNSLQIDTYKIQLNYLLSQGLLLLFCTVLLATITYITRFLCSYISNKITRNKRSEYFSKLIQFSNEDINKFSEASLITRGTNDINYLTNYISSYINIVLLAPISLCVGIFFAIITAPKLTWIIILAGIAIIVAAIIAVYYTTPTFARMQLLIDHISLKTRELISGQNIIRAFNNIEFEESKFDIGNKKLQDTNLFLGRFMAVINNVLALGYNFVSIVIVLVGGFYISKGDIQVGNVVAFIYYSGIILTSITNFGMLIGSMPRAHVCISRIDEVINTSLSLCPKGNLNLKIVDKLEFKNVSYAYTNTQTKTLENISFKLTSGETLGIVGATGSGKSTIAKLIVQTQKPTKGQILINNVDIKKYDIKQYKSIIGYAPQTSFLFKGSVKENINFSKNEDINNYINVVCLQDLIETLENGANSLIDPYSNNISGGQQQRISIARALSSEAQILVFDDCFSALDYSIEKQVLDNIFNSFKNPIKIIISSRLSTILNADTIIVLDEGRIVGLGKHDYLIKNCAEYIKLVKHQSSEKLFTE